MVHVIVVVEYEDELKEYLLENYVDDRFDVRVVWRLCKRYRTVRVGRNSGVTFDVITHGNEFTMAKITHAPNLDFGKLIDDAMKIGDTIVDWYLKPANMS